LSEAMRVKAPPKNFVKFRVVCETKRILHSSFKQIKKKQMANKPSLLTKIVWMAFILAVLLVVTSAIFFGAWNYAVPKLSTSVGSGLTFSNIDFATAIVSMIMFWVMLSGIAFPAL